MSKKQKKKLPEYKNPNNTIQIEGPVSLSIHDSREYKKIFYIFGDRHRFINECKGNNVYRIEKFLDKLFRENKQYDIDFFLEFPHNFADIFTYNPNLKNVTNDCYLIDTAKYFMTCFDTPYSKRSNSSKKSILELIFMLQI
jgi:hypothetical protein